MLFVRLEDLTGRIETLVFPSILKANPTLWILDAIVVINGRVSDKDGVPKVLVSDVQPFTPIAQKASLPEGGPFLINLPSGHTAKSLNLLKDILLQYPGSTQVHLKIPSDGKIRTVATKYSVSPTEDLKKAVDNLFSHLS